MKYNVQLILEDGTERFIALDEELGRKLSESLLEHNVVRLSNEKGEFVMINLNKVIAANIMADS